MQEDIKVAWRLAFQNYYSSKAVAEAAGVGAKCKNEAVAVSQAFNEGDLEKANAAVKTFQKRVIEVINPDPSTTSPQLPTPPVPAPSANPQPVSIPAPASPSTPSDPPSPNPVPAPAPAPADDTQAPSWFTAGMQDIGSKLDSIHSLMPRNANDDLIHAASQLDVRELQSAVKQHNTRIADIENFLNTPAADGKSDGLKRVWVAIGIGIAVAIVTFLVLVNVAGTVSGAGWASFAGLIATAIALIIFNRNTAPAVTREKE